MRHETPTLALLALLALAVAPTVEAQYDSAYYGLSLGEFDYDEGEGGFADNVSSYRLMVGYQFMKHLGVEGGYGETGTIRDSRDSSRTLAGTTHTVDFSSEFKILTVRLLGVLPFDNGVSLLAGLGVRRRQAGLQRSTIDGLRGSSGDISGNEPAYYAGGPIRLGSCCGASRLREVRLRRRSRRRRDERDLLLQALALRARPEHHAGTRMMPPSGGSVTTIEYG